MRGAYLMVWIWLGFAMLSLWALTHSDLAVLLVVTCFGTWWARDRSRHGHPTTMGHLLLFVWFWPVLVPAWLVRTRGVPGLGWVLLITLVWASCICTGGLLRVLVLGEEGL